MGEKITRRDFLRLGALGLASIEAACSPTAKAIFTAVPATKEPDKPTTIPNIPPTPGILRKPTETVVEAKGGPYNPEQQKVVDEWMARLKRQNDQWLHANQPGPGGRIWGEGATLEVQEYFDNQDKPTIDGSRIVWRVKGQGGKYVTVDVNGVPVDTFTFPHPTGVPLYDIQIPEGGSILEGNAPLPITREGEVLEGQYKGQKYVLGVSAAGFTRYSEDKKTFLQIIGPTGAWVDFKPEATAPEQPFKVELPPYEVSLQMKVLPEMSMGLAPTVNADGENAFDVLWGGYIDAPCERKYWKGLGINTLIQFKTYLQSDKSLHNGIRGWVPDKAPNGAELRLLQGNINGVSGDLRPNPVIQEKGGVYVGELLAGFYGPKEWMKVRDFILPILDQNKTGKYGRGLPALIYASGQDKVPNEECGLVTVEDGDGNPRLMWLSGARKVFVDDFSNQIGTGKDDTKIVTAELVTHAVAVNWPWDTGTTPTGVYLCTMTPWYCVAQNGQEASADLAKQMVFPGDIKKSDLLFK